MNALWIELDGHIIGTVGVGGSRDEYFPGYKVKKGSSIGIVISNRHWGHGCGPEAVPAVRDWIFEHTDTDMIVCDVIPYWL